MTRKLAFTALIAIAIAYGSVNDRLLMQDRLANKNQPSRQFIDAKQAKQQPAVRSVSESEVSPVASTNPVIATTPSLTFDTDIPLLSSSLDLAAIDTLIDTGHVLLDLPDGSQATLQRTGIQAQFGITHLQAEADGYVATITRRGDEFFATLANSNGSYRIEGNAAHSRVFPHQLIAQRRLQHETDYRHVHSSF
jgi:hypothetical protein